MRRIAAAASAIYHRPFPGRRPAGLARTQALSTPQADQLDEVVDYDFIRHSIAQRVARGHIQLQETLADELLHAMLAHPKVRAARVSTEKPDVYPDCEAVGVEVFGLKEPTA